MGSFLFSEGFGTIEVEQLWSVSGRQDGEGNWIQQGGKVALLVNGAYCHGDGLPFNDEDEIKRIFTTLDKQGNPVIIPEFKGLLANILEWFSHRHETEGVKIHKIMFDANGYPELEDGTPVLDEGILYQSLNPGPVLTAAIIGLNDRRRAGAAEAKAAIPEIYRQPEPPPGMPKVAGEKVAQPKVTGKGTGKPLTKTQLKVRREKLAQTRAAKASKATPNATPATQPESAAATG